MNAPFLTVSPPLPWDVYFRRPVASLPFPFRDGAAGLFPRARQGLYEGLRRLGLGSGDVALVPAYHHGSEIEAYVRAGLGLRYYEACPDLAPDPDELAARFDPSVRILHLTHYLGFAQDTDRWRAWCDQRGVFLVEDAAQGWLGSSGGRPLGTWGDLSLFSIYKTVGVPDGGAVALRGAMLESGGRRGIGLRAVATRHGAWLAGRWARAGAFRASRSVAAYDAERDFTLGDLNRAATLATSILLPRLVAARVVEERVRRYRWLLNELKPWVPEPFRRDPEAFCPFAFPVFVTDKTVAASVLMHWGIRAVDTWSVPHPTLPVREYPGALRRRSGVLLLPVHQELREGDLDRIVDASRAALGPPREV